MAHWRQRVVPALVVPPAQKAAPDKPGRTASRKTCANRAASAFRRRRRNSLSVRKSGASPATIIMKSARSTEALARRRDAYGPLA
jgi:hypothetical protein